jgi:hypothetical protein
MHLLSTTFASRIALHGKMDGPYTIVPRTHSVGTAGPLHQLCRRFRRERKRCRVTGIRSLRASDRPFPREKSLALPTRERPPRRARDGQVSRAARRPQDTTGSNEHVGAQPRRRRTDPVPVAGGSGAPFLDTATPPPLKCTRAARSCPRGARPTESGAWGRACTATRRRGCARRSRT